MEHVPGKSLEAILDQAKSRLLHCSRPSWGLCWPSMASTVADIQAGRRPSHDGGVLVRTLWNTPFTPIGRPTARKMPQRESEPTKGANVLEALDGEFGARWRETTGGANPRWGKSLIDTDSKHEHSDE